MTFDRDILDLIGEPTPKRRGRKPGDGGRAANPYRDRLYEQQARVAKLKADQLAGRLVLAADVEAEWANILADVRQQLLAIPSRVGAKLALSREAVAALDTEIRAALTTLAAQEGVPDAGRTRAA